MLHHDNRAEEIQRKAMAETAGVTQEVLKEKITQSLGAVHVEIEDMSGEDPATPPCDPLEMHSTPDISVPG